MKRGAIHDEAGFRCRIPLVFLASWWWERAAGLLRLPRLRRDEALLIAGCRAIHTLGMRYSIDVVFINKTGAIVRIVHDLPACRFRAAWSACMTLEMGAGEAARLGFAVGQSLLWKELPK